jgi:hypothetical protein
MNYQDWVKSVPQDITEDVLWTVTAYRYPLFLADLCWFDVTKLMRDKRTLDLLLTDSACLIKECRTEPTEPA